MSVPRTYRATTLIAAPLQEVFAFFSSPENLARITPPAMGFRITKAPAGPLKAGARIEYRIRVFGLPMRWSTLIDTWKENESFSDVQERGPYRFWRHVHSFREVEGGVRMEDEVSYALSFRWLGNLFGGWLVEREVRKIFDYRAKAIREIFG